MDNVLVTGATGFVGKALCRRLRKDGCFVRGTLLPSKSVDALPSGVEPVHINPIGPDTDWAKALTGIDTVIHLAARVHVMRDTAPDPLTEFRSVNAEGTAHLARQAAAGAVKRFVFVSTVGVNGNASNSKPFTEDDRPAPYNPYSVSKREAEERLVQIADETSMEIVVVRAPIVYGPGNPGNFLSLLRIVSKGILLPFASIRNKRSLIFIENLADALACCATNPKASGQTYMVSDGEDVSTSELINRVASALDKPARLVQFPPGLMRLVGKILGRSAVVERLVGSLQVDISKIRSELGWSPPFTMEQGLKETAEWFKNKVRNGERGYRCLLL